jgi:hypothetical protein
MWLWLFVMGLLPFQFRAQLQQYAPGGLVVGIALHAPPNVHD